jgi:hypothetical protein
MLPANEAKGSKHCFFKFVRHVEGDQKLCLPLDVCQWHKEIKKTWTGFLWRLSWIPQ